MPADSQATKRCERLASGRGNNRRLDNAGVVRWATTAFLSNDVILHLAGASTIVAQNPHISDLIGRHPVGSNLLVNLLPNLRHVANRLGTKRTIVLAMLVHLLQALQMQRMSAGKHVDILQGIEQKLHAHGAILMHRLLNACVAFSKRHGVAAPAFVTVEEILTASGSTDPAFVTVVLLLGGIIVEEVAFGAEKLPHADTAALADLLDVLLVGAERADYAFDGVAVDLVRLGLVVAMPA